MTAPRGTLGPGVVALGVPPALLARLTFPSTFSTRSPATPNSRLVSPRPGFSPGCTVAPVFILATVRAGLPAKFLLHCQTQPDGDN